MSMNLTLGEFPLFQTPTSVTYEALKEGNNPKQIYYNFLDKLVFDSKPFIHHRASSKQRKLIENTRKYQNEYENYRELDEKITEHKIELERFLKENPNIKWSME